mgnify:CR=1 FL=1
MDSRPLISFMGITAVEDAKKNNKKLVYLKMNKREYLTLENMEQLFLKLSPPKHVFNRTPVYN